MIDTRFLLWPLGAAGLCLISGAMLESLWWLGGSLLLSALIRHTEISIAKRHVTYAFRALDHQRRARGELEQLAAPLADAARMPVPRVFVVEAEDPMATAFAKGRPNDFIVLSSALVRLLNRNELSAVLGHELAHLRLHASPLINATRIFGLAALLNLLLILVTNWGGVGPATLVVLFLVIVPALWIVTLSFRRSLEYEADRIAARLCGEPLWLADALRKTEPVEPAPADGWPGLPSAHPPIHARIARLRSMSAGGR